MNTPVTTSCPASLEKEAEEALNQYLAAMAQENTVRDLLQRSHNARRRLFKTYLHRYDQLQKHPSASPAVAQALRRRLKEHTKALT